MTNPSPIITSRVELGYENEDYYAPILDHYSIRRGQEVVSCSLETMFLHISLSPHLAEYLPEVGQRLVDAHLYSMFDEAHKSLSSFIIAHHQSEIVDPYDFDIAHCDARNIVKAAQIISYINDGTPFFYLDCDPSHTLSRLREMMILIDHSAAILERNYLP